jgi:hypothetical protein
MLINRKDAYEFIAFRDENNTYAFVTEQGIVYEVKFKQSNYIFAENSSYNQYTFEFVIEVAENLTHKKPSLDSRIPLTIALIFQDFFTLRETIVVYICDNSDSKANARNRKFSQWFEQYNKLSLMKIDFVFGTNLEKYFTSLIMRIDNPNMVEIIGEIQDLSTNYENK